MGDQTVGLQARMMSQAMRKLAGNLNRANTLCIFTNQIREKVGVMFGCFHYDARVVLADGSTEKIGKIVKQQLPVEVMSMDPESGEISPRRIVDWYDNGETDEWLQFEVEAGGGSGKRKFACTPNHVIFTPGGERQAWEIEEGDEVLVAVKHYALREDQMKLIVGSLLGDGSLRYASAHNAAFRVGHGERQREYCEWKHGRCSLRSHTGIGTDRKRHRFRHDSDAAVRRRYAMPCTRRTGARRSARSCCRNSTSALSPPGTATTARSAATTSAGGTARRRSAWPDFAIEDRERVADALRAARHGPAHVEREQPAVQR